MARLRQIYREACGAIDAGQTEAALSGLVQVMRGAPGFVRARQRVGDALLGAGHRASALSVYRALAEHAIASGRPLRALALCKAALELDPRATELLERLALRYLGATGEALGEAAGDPLEVEAAASASPTQDLEATAMALALDLPPTSVAQLPAIPLFSRLSTEAFLKVARKVRIRRAVDGERIITEGERADSFFIITDGTARVSRRIEAEDVTLAQLGEGAVFGEMALVLRVPRTATVTAEGEVELIELSRRELELHAGQLESVSQALKTFTRERLLMNLVATSPLFRTLDREDRLTLLGKFQPRSVFGDDVLISEGAEGRELFVIVRGEFEVTQARGSETRLLRSGDVFGEIALLRSRPASATVTAACVGEVLALSRGDFDDMLVKYPGVKSTLIELADARLSEAP